MGMRLGVSSGQQALDREPALRENHPTHFPMPSWQARRSHHEMPLEANRPARAPREAVKTTQPRDLTLHIDKALPNALIY